VILSVNCPEWVHVDLGTILYGMKSAGVYPNSTPKDVHYILGQTDASIITVQNRGFWEKIVGEKGEYPLPKQVKTVVVLDGDTSISPLAISYEDAIAQGKKIAQSTRKTKLSEFLDQIDPDEGRFIIYTSGTTGNPRGALLSLDNLTYTAEIAAEFWKLPYAQGTLCSFLPLCHVAEKIQNIGVGITQRYTVNFVTKIDHVAKELPEIEPTLLLSVPRLWEKMMEGVLHKVDASSGVQKKLALWALDVGKRVAEAKYSGRFVHPKDLIQYRIADRLVLSKIRKAMGLGKAELLASGAAALPAHVSKWFRCLGLEILEDFGQTESTGVICMTQPGIESAGTVGKPVPGVEVKIAEDGELLTRGRHVFKGYYKDPEATANTLKDGWLHTGDLAEVNDRGLIRIKGRKKEVLKTSGGKMIAPLPIEETLKAHPKISHVCIVGDGRKYLTALVTLSEKALAEAKKDLDPSARVIEDGALKSEIKARFDEVNETLASYEQIKRFEILAHEFSVEAGEMTPTLKMKRSVVEKRYQDVIDGMYAS
jgi:long-chain acyl-CoA synthetase